MSDGRLQLIRVRAENAQRIELVDETPDGRHLVVEGRNSAGKTALLNAIAMAIGGKKLAPETPIRRGSRRAKVTLDLGSLEVERTITDRTDTVSVTNKGKPDMPYPRPQEFLNGLFSLVAFDPSSFERMKPQDQARNLRELSGLDTEALDRERADLYDQRTMVGRDVRRALGYLDTLEPVLDAPDAPVVVSELTQMLAQAEAANQRYATWAQEVQHLKDRKDRIEQQIAELQEELAQVRVRGQKLMQDKPARTETGPIVQAIGDAEKSNDLYRRAEEMRRATEEHAQHQDAYDALSRRIEEIDAERDRRLQAARFPVDGLSIEGDTVLYNGIPLADCSQSERLRVLASIGAALNPRMGFCILRDAAWFDPDTMREFLADMSERGIQVIAERPGRDEFATIVMEAGRVVERSGQAVADDEPVSAVEEAERPEPPDEEYDPFAPPLTDEPTQPTLDSEEFWG